MSLYQLRLTIAHQKQTLNSPRSWQSFPPRTDMTHDMHPPKQTQRAYERTMQRMEMNWKEKAEDSERDSRACP